MSFQDRYENAPYVVRLRAPILRVITFFSIGIMPLTIINALINKQYSTIIITLLMIMAMSYSLYSLYKGKYDRAASISIGIFAFSLISSAQLLGYTGEHAFVLNAVYSILLSVYAMVFAPNFKAVLLYTSLGIGSYIILIVRSFLSGSITELSVKINQQLIIPTTMLLMISLIIILARRIQDRVTRDAIEKISESREQAENLVTLASETSKKLTIAQSMEEQAIETAASAEKIEKNTEIILENTESLVSRYDSSQKALDTIAEKMADLDSVAEDQSANITETGAAMEEMVSSIKNVSTVIKDRMTAMDKLRDTASSGEDTINKTVTAFDRVTENLDEVKQMISIISSIASRTNLLAMNAAIEAAHAGDAGRGFAVVADEVRKLAESSAMNAKQVGETIQQLMNAINESGSAISESGDSFKSIGKEIEEVGHAMDSIDLSIRELATGSDEILTATSFLNKLTSKVTTMVQDTREKELVVHENVDNMGSFILSLKQNMSEINDDTRQIRDVSGNLRDKCNTINSFIQDFSGKLRESQTIISDK